MRKFIVLPMAILMCVFMVTPAFAVSDGEWVSPTLSFSKMESGSNRFQVYGTMTAYDLDDNGMGLFDYTQNIDTGYDIPYGQYDVVKDTSGNWVCNLPVPSSSFNAPYTHYESDEKTYYRYYDYPQFSLKGPQAIFFSDCYLEPGFYEISANFAISQYVIFSTSSQYFRPAVYTVGFEGSRKGDVEVSCIPANCNFTVELKERSRLYFSCTPNSIMDSYPYTSSASWPYLRYTLNVSSFKYRSIDPAAVAALDSANTDAQNSIQQNDQLETEWVGVMNDNFNSLDLANFSWDSGLVGAFSLVSELFMRFWSALGKYNILYVFPLTLAVVLLLVGRISRYEGKRPTGKGDD